MTVLDIVTYPDPRLREPTFDVKEVDANIRQLVRDLIDTMYSLNAAGIAAIQVGRLERIFIIDGKVADPEAGDDAKPLVLINPELVETGRGLAVAEEGCLSFPNVFVDIKRPRWAKVRAMDVDGNTFEVDGEGLFGRAMQHEHDHLTGRLSMDLFGAERHHLASEIRRSGPISGAERKWMMCASNDIIAIINSGSCPSMVDVEALARMVLRMAEDKE